MIALVLYMICRPISGIPVDNDVLGLPEIHCGADHVAVSFVTRNTFEGHVFVKGHYSEAPCRTEAQGLRSVGLALALNSCGLKRARSLSPLGVFVTTTVIISFHRKFVTKVDKAYRIRCFYMEAQKTVETAMQVSMLTTQLRHQQVPMPTCTYSVRSKTPNGPTVSFAKLGDKVVHKWECLSDQPEVFCITVHSCFVDDGNGDRADVVDPNGCAVDKYLMQTPEYIESKLQAHVASHVFKYADRHILYFQCQINIEVRNPKSRCNPPVCPKITSTRFLYRGKRQSIDSGVDIISQPMTILDISTVVGDILSTRCLIIRYIVVIVYVCIMLSYLTFFVLFAGRSKC